MRGGRHPLKQWRGISIQNAGRKIFYKQRIDIMKHKIKKLAIAGTVGYNFSVNQNDANFQFAMDDIEALAYGENLDPLKYTELIIPCYDIYGNKTEKKRKSCMNTGYLPSCTPHGCK